jgi:hypothetical protein
MSGEFNGFEDQNTIFEFHGGQKWRRVLYYYYYYAYMPRAKVVRDGGRCTSCTFPVSNQLRK